MQSPPHMSSRDMRFLSGAPSATHQHVAPQFRSSRSSDFQASSLKANIEICFQRIACANGFTFRGHDGSPDRSPSLFQRGLAKQEDIVESMSSFGGPGERPPSVFVTGCGGGKCHDCLKVARVGVGWACPGRGQSSLRRKGCSSNPWPRIHDLTPAPLTCSRSDAPSADVHAG